MPCKAVAIQSFSPQKGIDYDNFGAFPGREQEGAVDRCRSWDLSGLGGDRDSRLVPKPDRIDFTGGQRSGNGAELFCCETGLDRFFAKGHRQETSGCGKFDALCECCAEEDCPHQFPEYGCSASN
jgi:hypothetical protein